MATGDFLQGPPLREPIVRIGNQSIFVTEPWRKWLYFNRVLLDFSGSTAGNVVVVGSDGSVSDSGYAGASSDYVGVDDTQTLTNKTLTTPTIGDFTNATHNHEDDSGGGLLDVDALGTAFKDEDNMASNSATAVASQQSIKMYADNYFRYNFMMGS